jgi:hypothetical protein
VIEASLMRKKKLTKMATAVALEAKVVNVASFLSTKRNQIPSPYVLCVADVEAFMAIEPIEAVLMNAVESVLEESLQAPGGPIPSILNHPPGSNIQHILEDIDMDSEESTGMGDDNMGPSTTAAARTPQKPLSPIPEVGATSRASTPKRPQSLTPA